MAQTMTDSMALYGETGEAAKTSGAYAEPELLPVAGAQPMLAKQVLKALDALPAAAR